ncbi:MAG: hypothetical protein LUD02_13720 [Tannerellaceae bacterium]|nr:hypothetical protein [Tannerellaceae bacterium]
MQIYDDSEKLIGKTVIFAWVNFKEGEEKFNSIVASSLKAALTILKTKNVFEADCFMHPFSVSYTDEDFLVIEEVLFVDDDMFRLDDPLLKDLDTELDSFINNLLSDID